MSFEELFADVARVIEGVGVVIMTAGLVFVLLRYAYAAASAGTRTGSYERLRVSMGRVILLGLQSPHTTTPPTVPSTESLEEK